MSRTIYYYSLQHNCLRVYFMSLFKSLWLFFCPLTQVALCTFCHSRPFKSLKSLSLTADR